MPSFRWASFLWLLTYWEFLCVCWILSKSFAWFVSFILYCSKIHWVIFKCLSRDKHHLIILDLICWPLNFFLSYFSSFCLYDLLIVFGFCQLAMVIWDVRFFAFIPLHSHWTSCVCKLMSLVHFRKSLAIICTNSLPLSLSSSGTLNV